MIERGKVKWSKKYLILEMWTQTEYLMILRIMLVLHYIDGAF